ncbi:MAG: prepilin-type N-terminal cleavage/methylation domain-containing protein [Nitrospinaceae bacterium]
MKTERGFTLLEVMVAMAILGFGFLLIVQLFSGGVRLASASDQYLKGVALAHHKLGQLELAHFAGEETSGGFKGEPGYRWALDKEPFASPLNQPDENIQLSQVTLTVSWEDGSRPRTVQLASLWTEGEYRPVPDTVQVGNLSALGVSNSGGPATSQDQAASPSSAQHPSGPLGPGAVPTPLNASAPAADPNFRFDISGAPTPAQPTQAQGLIGVNK